MTYTAAGPVVRMIKSAHLPGGIRRAPDSHASHARGLEWIKTAASRWVRPAAARRALMAPGAGVRASRGLGVWCVGMLNVFNADRIKAVCKDFENCDVIALMFYDISGLAVSAPAIHIRSFFKICNGVVNVGWPKPRLIGIDLGLVVTVSEDYHFWGDADVHGISFCFGRLGIDGNAVLSTGVGREPGHNMGRGFVVACILSRSNGHCSGFFKVASANLPSTSGNDPARILQVFDGLGMAGIVVDFGFRDCHDISLTPVPRGWEVSDFAAHE